ncbi:MAG: flagellar protein FliS [Raoultibacter sp.]
MQNPGNEKDTQHSGVEKESSTPQHTAPSPRPSVRPRNDDTPKPSNTSTASSHSAAWDEEHKRKQPLAFYIAIAVAILAVIVAGVLVFNVVTNATLARDPNATLGQLEGKTPEEVQAELNRIVEEGMFNISIASTVEFADGASEGELRIENIPTNPYLMKVEISRDDNAEVVYTSQMIEPNHHIQKAKLSVDLDAGTYPCTAVFYAYDIKTENLVGQAAAKLTLTILK